MLNNIISKTYIMANQTRHSHTGYVVIEYLGILNVIFPSQNKHTRILEEQTNKRRVVMEGSNVSFKTTVTVSTEIDGSIQ